MVLAHFSYGAGSGVPTTGVVPAGSHLITHMEQVGSGTEVAGCAMAVGTGGTVALALAVAVALTTGVALADGVAVGVSAAVCAAAASFDAWGAWQPTRPIAIKSWVRRRARGSSMGGSIAVRPATATVDSSREPRGRALRVSFHVEGHIP